MLTYYQPFLLPFLRFKAHTLPSGIARRYFLSFEDALWTLLSEKHVPKGSVVLIPDFYCMDVVQNIKNHGYTPIFYPLDNHFRISKQRLHAYAKQYNPSVIILFHACGIPNELLHDAPLVQAFAGSAIIIEDCVQQLVDPEKVRIHHGNHFVLDSLRKVTTLSGSFLYGKSSTLPMRPPALPSEIRYTMGTFLLYAMFRSIFLLSVFMRHAKLASFAHLTILKTHDNFVGDSTLGHRGWILDELLHRFIDTQRVQKKKYRQSVLYARLLQPIFHDKSAWYSIRIPSRAYGLLHVYPVGIRHNKDKEILTSIETYLLEHGAPVWFKFTDSPWSERRAVLFLPLGFHVSNSDIRKMCYLLTSTPAI